MDRLRNEFATETEFEIALCILDILKEQPQVFLVEDVLKRLHEKCGADKAKRLLCDHVFIRMENLKYIELIIGAVKLDHKGVLYIATKNLTGIKKIIAKFFYQ